MGKESYKILPSENSSGSVETKLFFIHLGNIPRTRFELKR